jgi:peptidyl-tRNA hydrolase
LGCFQKACEKMPDAVDTWFSGGQAKVVCKCETADELYEKFSKKVSFSIKSF